MQLAALPGGRKSLLLPALAAAIIGVAWWWQRPPPEPVYHGQRLSEYLTSDFEPVSVGGLHAFGPRMLPWLTYTVEHGRHQASKPGPHPFDNAPDWLRRLLPERWGGLRGSWAEDERISAAISLIELGPEAEPAIPALVRSLEVGDDALSDVAAQALHSIGPASWPAVEDVLNHPTNGRQFLLAHMHERANRPAPDSEIEHAVRALVKACHDPDPEVRIWALEGVSECRTEHPESTLFSPALAEVIRLLSDPQSNVRTLAAHTVGDFSAQAASAIPRLIELLDDPDVTVRATAAESLAYVDRAGTRSAARLRVMALGDSDPDCRREAERALKTFSLSPEEERASREASLAR